MTYKDQLNLLSDAIFNFDQEVDSNLQGLLLNLDKNSIRIYRKNLFFLILSRLEEDYSVVLKYLEHNNFNYLVRKYLLDKKILAVDISVFSSNFSSYLKEINDFHQDQLLVDLAKLDCLYAHSTLGTQCKVASGVFAVWARYVKGDVPSEFEVDFHSDENILCVEENGERFLKLRTD